MPFFPLLAARVRSLCGWKSSVLAFLLGACLTLAFPPAHFFPALIIAFSGWVWLLDGAVSKKSAFWRGWWFGLGHFTSGLYWITIALGIDDGAYLWLVPFALLLLPSYLAIFSGGVALGYYLVPLQGVRRILWLAMLWLVGEYLRSYLLSGFPWNLTGYVWATWDSTLQPASIVGVYGLGLWAVIAGSAGSLLAEKQRKVALCMIALGSVAIAGWGYARLETYPLTITGDAPVIRLVQANVPQSLKWDPTFQMRALQQHIEMSSRPTGDGKPLDYIVWPETAMPFPLKEHSRWTALLAEIAPENGALITGVMRMQGEKEALRIWNSMQAVDSAGSIVSSYDKNKLVPFGEFLPLRGVLSWFGVDKVTYGSLDFSRGEGAQVVPLPGKTANIQPLICYEVIFPHFFTKLSQDRPNWMLNITNDAWFGISSGPYQHFHMARTRAVERGVPLIRVANTGISGGFDAYGRILGMISLNNSGILDVTLPLAILVPTWYSRYGEFALLIICGGMLLWVFRLPRRAKRGGLN